MRTLSALNQQIPNLEGEYEQTQIDMFQLRKDFEMILKYEKNKMESEIALKNPQMNYTLIKPQNRKIDIEKEIEIT
jgi:hypothetical protein